MYEITDQITLLLRYNIIKERFYLSCFLYLIYKSSRNKFPLQIIIEFICILLKHNCGIFGRYIGRLCILLILAEFLRIACTHDKSLETGSKENVLSKHESILYAEFFNCKSYLILEKLEKVLFKKSNFLKYTKCFLLLLTAPIYYLLYLFIANEFL